jgi:dGTPase
LIDAVDEIAYNNHDVDDGLASSLIEPEALQTVDLWRHAHEDVRKRWPQASFADLKPVTISRMISTLVEDLILTTLSRLKEERVETVSDVRKASKSLTGFSAEIGGQNEALKKFLHENMYNHYRVIRMEEKARRIIRELFAAYLERPEQLPREFTLRMKKDSIPRLVCDYIAGMTDRFAMDEHMKLFDPHTRV